MGAITSSSVAALGSGYFAGETIKVLQGANDTARIVILTVDGSGVPLTYLLPHQISLTGPVQQPGCGYTVATNVPTTSTPTGGGIGSGFAINIDAVGPDSDATHGGITSIGVNNVGSGYVLHDTGLIVQGANQSAAYKIQGVSGGAIIALLVSRGDGYAFNLSGATNATALNAGPQPGVGSGAQFNIDDILQCDFIPGGSGYQNRVFGGPSNQ